MQHAVDDHNPYRSPASTDYRRRKWLPLLGYLGCLAVALGTAVFVWEPVYRFAYEDDPGTDAERTLRGLLTGGVVTAFYIASILYLGHSLLRRLPRHY